MILTRIEGPIELMIGLRNAFRSSIHKLDPGLQLSACMEGDCEAKDKEDEKC